MITRLRTLLFVAIALLTTALFGSGLVRAQDGTQPSHAGAPAGQVGFAVTGRVLCADTQRAARFAQVQLIPASSSVGEGDRGRRANARTDLDGRFTMNNVPPGDYFVTAQATGYVNESVAVQMALSAGGDALNAVAAVPRVQVTAGGASVQLSLQRGAILAGTVQWDDGSPAAGVQVSAQAAPTTGLSSASDVSGGNRLGLYNGFSGGGQTDDRGRFRLSGLAPGSYVLRASVQSPMPEASDSRFQRLMTLNVYAPNKLRKTDATVFALTPGEERADVNIALGLAGMHTVTGQVGSAAGAVRSGSVLLTDQTDSSLNRRGTIEADGSFTIPYVPPGNYTLRVTASAQPAGGRGGDLAPSSSGSTVRFQPLQTTVTVADSDVSGLALNVAPAASSPTP